MLGVAFSDANHGWAVGGGGNAVIVATTDGGAHWNAQSASFPDSSVSLPSVAFANSSDGCAVGSLGGYDYQSLIRNTTEGGTDWNVQTDTVNVGLSSVTFNNVSNDER